MTRFFNIVQFLFFSLFITISYGQTTQEIPKEFIPTYDRNIQLIYHHNYILGYSEKHEQAAFVIYKLTENELHKTVERNNHFEEDPLVITSSADDEDYYKSGYDRGHLAPAADMSFSKDAMEESFYYSNISPQVPAFNRGIWKQAEEKVRDWAKEKDSLYIVTGPILTDDLPKIYNTNVSIPKYYYKIAVEAKSNKYAAIGIILKNEDLDTDLNDHYVTIDSIENISHLNFFPQLLLSSQTEMEKTLNVENWEEKSDAKSTNKDIPTIKSSQCQGTTQKGNRCKRKVQNGEKFCWQHQ